MAPDEAEALRRLGRALSLRRPMLLTRYAEAYHLTSYLRRHTREPLRFVFGASTLVQIFQAAHYADLIGGVLEATGRLLAENVRLYVYPMERPTFRRILDEAGIPGMVEQGSLEDPVTVESIRLTPPQGHLYDYLRDAGWIVCDRRGERVDRWGWRGPQETRSTVESGAESSNPFAPVRIGTGCDGAPQIGPNLETYRHSAQAQLAAPLSPAVTADGRSPPQSTRTTPDFFCKLLTSTPL